MSNTFEERLTKTETQQVFNDQVLQEQRSDIKEIKNTVNEIKTALAVIQYNSQNKPDLEPRVRTLEDKANQVFGGWKTIALFAGVGGLILKECITWLRGH